MLNGCLNDAPNSKTRPNTHQPTGADWTSPGYRSYEQSSLQKLSFDSSDLARTPRAHLLQRSFSELFAPVEKKK